MTKSDNFNVFPTTTIRAVLLAATESLTLISDVPQLEAEVLLGSALKQPRSYLHTWPELKLAECVIACFYDLINRRRLGEPVAYLTGTKEFWTLDLAVNSATLIPRPETELIVELVLNLNLDVQLMGGSRAPKIADLGTGNGAIALSIAREQPGYQLFATDVSEHALCVAKENAHRLAINNISFSQGSWCAALSMNDFDVIVSNPPYIAETEWPLYANGLCFEPYSALVSGEDGLNAIREIIETAQSHLRRGGYLLIEHGAQQGLAVRNLMAIEGYVEITTHADLAGLERVTVGRSNIG